MVKFPRRLEELLPAAAMDKVLEVLQQPDVAGKVREAMNKMGLRDATPLDKVKDAWQQARAWLDTLADLEPKKQAEPIVLNATGHMLDRAISSPPVSASVAYGYAKAASNYAHLQSLQERAEAAVRAAFPKHSGVWIRSTAMSLQLIANRDRGRNGVVLSRADSVRFPGLGDVRTMLELSRHPVIEVGAANGVSTEDWSSALTDSQQQLYLCSPNALSAQAAFEHRQSACQAARAVGAEVVEVLADAVLSDRLADSFAFPHARRHLEGDADIVVLPAQFLIGGPSAALVIGSAEIVNALRRNAESVGCLLDAGELTAATLALQLASLGDDIDSGVSMQLLANPENLKNRAERLAIQLDSGVQVGTAAAFERPTELGPTPWNRHSLNNWAVGLEPRESFEALAHHLRAGAERHNLHIETVRDGQSMLIDLRFVPPQHDHEIVLAFGSV